MKGYWYIVAFTSGEPERVYCLGKTQAKILAQANRIKAGKAYDVFSVTQEQEKKTHGYPTFDWSWQFS